MLKSNVKINVNVNLKYCSSLFSNFLNINWNVNKWLYLMKVKVPFPQLYCCIFSQCVICVAVVRVAGTCEPWWGRVWLDLVLSVVLDQVPQVPDEFWVEDVKWLLRLAATAFNVPREQIEVRLLEPLKTNNTSVGVPAPPPCTLGSVCWPSPTCNWSRTRQPGSWVVLRVVSLCL